MGNVVSGIGKLGSNVGSALKKVADPADIFGGNPNSPLAPKSPLPNVATDPTSSLTNVTNEGQALLKAYSSGTLTPGQQSEVSQYTQGANAALKQQMASAGISNSSSAVQAGNVVNEQAAAMTQQFLDTDLTNSMDLLGMNMNAYYQTESLDIQQNEGIMGSLGDLAGAIGSII